MKDNYNGESGQALLGEKTEGKSSARRAAMETQNVALNSAGSAAAGAYAVGFNGAIYGSLFGGPLGAIIGAGVGVVGGAVVGSVGGSYVSHDVNERKRNATCELIEKIGPAVAEGTQELLREGIKSQDKLKNKKTGKEVTSRTRKSGANTAFFDAAIDLAIMKFATGKEGEWKLIETQLTNAIGIKDIDKGFAVAAEALSIQCDIAGVKCDKNIKNFGLTDMQVKAKQEPSFAESVEAFFSGSNTAPEGYKKADDKTEEVSKPKARGYEPPKLPENGHSGKYAASTVSKNGYSGFIENGKQSSGKHFLS